MSGTRGSFLPIPHNSGTPSVIKRTKTQDLIGVQSTDSAVASYQPRSCRYGAARQSLEAAAEKQADPGVPELTS